MEGQGKDKGKGIMEEGLKGKGIMEAENLNTLFTALVVDNDKKTRVIHQKLLSGVGGRSHAVENGKEAVDIIHCMDQSFDVILIAKEMPVMDGIEATKLLRSMGVSSKIIGVSSCPMGEIREFVDAGLDDFYRKPLTANMLDSIIDTILS